MAGADERFAEHVDTLSNIDIKSIAQGVVAVADLKSRTDILAKMALNAAANSSPSLQWNRVKSGIRDLYHGDFTSVGRGTVDALAIAGGAAAGKTVRFFAGATKARFFTKGGVGEQGVETQARKALNNVILAQEEFSATNPNAADALTRKYKALEGAQNGAVRSKTLKNESIRYYDAEVPSRKPGATRGTAYVTEYNPKTGDVHAWMESYDQLGNVNRIHPKMYNGQILSAPHYPPILKEKLEAEINFSGYRWR